MTQEQMEDILQDLLRTVQKLGTRLDRIEEFITGDSDEIVISCGESSIRLNKTDVQLKAGHVNVSATHNAQVRASGNLVLKAGKIIEN